MRLAISKSLFLLIVTAGVTTGFDNAAHAYAQIPLSARNNPEYIAQRRNVPNHRDDDFRDDMEDRLDDRDDFRDDMEDRLDDRDDFRDDMEDRLDDRDDMEDRLDDRDDFRDDMEDRLDDRDDFRDDMEDRLDDRDDDRRRGSGRTSRGPSPRGPRR